MMVVTAGMVVVVVVCVSMGTSLLVHNQVFVILGNFGFHQVGGKKECLMERFQRMGPARH